ncbi:vWA domain-containing protein [Methanohalophilus portucalensis]|uniref:VWA domain-containing protein n=2 Tax=Methanohalophilus portucalensis TaxID=39664 RepID=A0A1L9C2H0_9EURY|nr:vWA domain-containing protein [Methanohalophilus portucalensis]ATU08186.1 hypothetical protein BKM01_05025 [Methanohalophilus portucalensis]OJH48656.1 von Willebrand factor A [Methanohalophilus portucalensis FDF-1]RNI10164.1 VWA domain-containing protein [Methanohalophilus portucalensis FDF-1]SMH43605.1 von Willebrand factor type A domain-containing protein [Methanohalophilus portucalensis FDF-1]
MLSFEQPIILAFILPVLAGTLYLMLKGGNKKLLISRAIVLSLLIVAIASPFTLVSQVTEQENPQLVIISDETKSMQLFEEGVADELYESLTTKTPTSLVRLTGDKTALGDAVVQYASSDNQVVLVTDGNNNYGENLEDSLQYAEKINSTVYAVTPETQHNDMSVRIEGEKTAVLGEYIFDIVVEQANRDLVDYSINLKVDEKKRNGLLSTINPHSTKQNVIRPKEPVIFESTGAHTIEVELVPRSEDYDSINNKFTKSVYVVPKPKVQYVTGESYNSPFARDLNQLYTPVTDDNFTQLDGKKAVIIDNLYIDALNEEDITNLQKYVTNGGGLVVIGGNQAYNNGDYRNSSLEKLLPVYSYPTESTGGEVVVLVIDKSGSILGGDYKPPSYDPDEKEYVPGQGLQDKGINKSEMFFISYVKESAKNVTKNPDFSDAKMGIIAFDDEGHILSELQALNKKSNQKDIEEIIDSIGAGSGSDLGAGLQKTTELLEDVPGQKIIMILSDGKIENYYANSIQKAQSIQKEHNVVFQFFRFSDPSGTDYAEKFIQEIEGEAVLGENYFITPEGFTVGDIQTDQSQTDGRDEEEDVNATDTYLLVEYNPTHFITENSEVSNVTFYNGVTAKPGSERVVLAEDGSPVITTWRYGLGRVASVTTDHNNFGNQDNLTAATLNWAVADPQPEEGAVVKAPDTWYGLPAKITLTMYDEKVPELTYRDNELELAFVGKNTYEAQIFPKTIGMHYVSGYPIAVNYAIEYRDVGLNEKLPSHINQNGGKVYDNIQQARAKLLEDARQNSLQSRMEPVSWKMYFILAALLLFLGEVMLRRSLEIIESRKQE